MSIENTISTLFKGFSKLTYKQRFERLCEMGVISRDDIHYLQRGGLQSPDLAENFIENVIGYFQMPLGVATNMCIDGRDYAIPMAVEETSIIAAVSKTAKWIKESGEITTEIVGDNIIGQIQLAKVTDFDKFERAILSKKEYLIDLANKNIAASMYKRGGGINDLHIRQISQADNTTMAVIHILLNPCDAMGANLITQICEYLKGPVEAISGEKVTMCILSNLSDTKLTRARVVLRQPDPVLANAIEQASRFADSDPYRAATHNKGVLNGIDPILIATGNDWRAVEAGVHAYAARTGSYRAISTWRYQDEKLIGEFEAPIMVGTIGGVTRLHPTAQLSLKMLGIQKANELARICAATGLVQNLGALTALSSVGLIQGHMKLHISNLTISTDADETERPILRKRLEETLKRQKQVTLQHAVEHLQAMRRVELS